MESRKKQTAIFYIKKSEAVLYINKLPSPLILHFSGEIVDNLEVISKDKLQTLIHAFIQKHEIKPANISFILDKNVTFEKDITEDSIPKQREEIEKFLDIVPFEKIISKVYRTKTSIKVIAANQEFYDELISAFAEDGFFVNAVTPVSLIEKITSSTKKDFDPKTAFAKIDLIKHHSLFESLENQEKFITNARPEVKSRQFIFLVSTFAILLVILLFLIYSQLFLSSPK